MRRWCRLVCAVSVLVVSGCGWFDSPSTPDSSAPTETFSGTLAVLGSNTFTFTVKQAGTVSVTLATLTPASTVSLGVGTPSGTGSSTACTLTSSTTNATAGSTPQFTFTGQPGSLCVQISDGGKLTASTTFTINVTHS